MKLFKGEMSLWAQLNDVKKMNRPGGMMDPLKYRTAVVCLILGGAYFFFWDVVDMFANFYGWLHHPALWLHWSPPWHEPPGAIRKYHFYAILWLIWCVVLAVISVLYTWSVRRRARKSARGQWYDKPGLKKEDLYGKPNGANKTKQAKP